VAVPATRAPKLADMTEAIVPDTKDWTWVLETPCQQCGFDAKQYAVGDLSTALRRTVPRWQQVLQRQDAAQRPVAGVWSPAEYACHVRDVYELFRGRVQLMLDQDDPVFADWDQDATALQERYSEQAPATVAGGLGDRGEAFAQILDDVPTGGWMRPGRRSNGSVFTVESLSRYALHDVVHHLHDVDG